MKHFVPSSIIPCLLTWRRRCRPVHWSLWSSASNVKETRTGWPSRGREVLWDETKGGGCFSCWRWKINDPVWVSGGPSVPPVRTWPGTSPLRELLCFPARSSAVVIFNNWFSAGVNPTNIFKIWAVNSLTLLLKSGFIEKVSLGQLRTFLRFKRIVAFIQLRWFREDERKCLK